MFYPVNMTLIHVVLNVIGSDTGENNALSILSFSTGLFFQWWMKKGFYKYG